MLCFLFFGFSLLHFFIYATLGIRYFMSPYTSISELFFCTFYCMLLYSFLFLLSFCVILLSHIILKLCPYFAVFEMLLSCVRLHCGAVCGDESDSQYGLTPLMRAAACGRVDCARLLIDSRANKQATDWVRCWLLLGWSTSIALYFLYTAALLSSILSAFVIFIT
jgi:hypothetical protein